MGKQVIPFLIVLLGAVVMVGCSEVPGFIPIDGESDDNNYETIEVTPPEGYSLVWSDEFQGNEIDTDIWNFDVGGHGWGNNEIQFYTDRTTGDNRNAYVEGGKLYIVARHEEYEHREFTSARLTTKDTKAFQYGRLEARIKAPHSISNPTVMDGGVWPAFWMLGDSYPDVPWPRSGEIDIWEGGGADPTHVSGAVHYSTTATGRTNHSSTSRTIDFETPLHHNFHVYAIEWDEASIVWYIDDVEVGEWVHDWVTWDEGINPMQAPYYFLLNLAIEGNYYFSGTADPANYPQQMIVDYVRVFQKL